MTAPKVIWVEPSIAVAGTHGSTAWPDRDDDCISYIRADAPELLVLVALVRDCIETNSEFQTQWDKDATSALAAWEALAEANARADRAEAALAAQIEADALVCDELAAACAMALALAANDTPEVRTAVAYSIKIAKRCAATIRNQPNDRSALDRMLAEAEARGYEIAKAEAARAGWHLRRYDLAKRDAELANAKP